MAARESEDANMTTICVPNTNDISEDEEMSDATEKKDVAHNRHGVSPIHVPAEWGKAESTGNADPESLERRQQRAKRFGVSSPEAEEKSTNDLDLDSLYRSLGVSTKSEDRLRVEGIREEAIHIRGIDNMTTQDVFHFFKDFNPGSIEWIDDTSCNVVWLDNETSARALLKLTYDVTHVPEFKEHGRTSKSSSVGDNRIKAREESMAVDASGGTGGSTRPRSRRRRNASDDDNLDLLSSDNSSHESSSKEDSDADEETGEKDREPDEETGEKKRKSRDSNRVTAARGVAANGTAAVGSTEAVKVTGSGDHTERMDMEEEEASKMRSFRCEGKEITLPRGQWRVGLLINNKKYLFLRFATKADVKPLGARVQSQYYMPQSNPTYTGVEGLTSESRKRKLRASQWRLEEEDGEIVEEGFDARDEILSRTDIRSSSAHDPGLTSMDRHIKAAETERVRLHKHRLCSDEDDEALDAEAELAVLLSSSPPTEAPPPPKRKMRMYADDIEEQSKSKSSTAVSRVATKRDARSMIESRRRGKLLGSERLSQTQDDLDDDLPARRSSDRRGQHRDLRDRLGRRKDSFDTARDSYGDRLGRRKDDFEGRLKYEKLTIEVEQD